MIGKQQLGALFIGIICGAIVSILPIVVVNHKHLALFFTAFDRQMQVFAAICIGTAAVTYMRRQRVDKKSSQIWQIKKLPELTVIYLFCYTTCAALCQRLDLTAINAHADMNSSLYSPSLLSAFGLLLVAFAAVVQVMDVLEKKLPGNVIFRPVYWSWLLFMIGVALIFGVWLPLIALPGVFVMLKWLAKSAPEKIIN